MDRLYLSLRFGSVHNRNNAILFSVSLLLLLLLPYFSEPAVTAEGQPPPPSWVHSQIHDFSEEQQDVAAVVLKSA